MEKVTLGTPFALHNVRFAHVLLYVKDPLGLSYWEVDYARKQQQLNVLKVAQVRCSAVALMEE